MAYSAALIILNLTINNTNDMLFYNYYMYICASNNN